jgi:alpha-glucosidase
VLAFRRGDGLVCALNMGSRPARIEAPGGVTLASGPVEDQNLLPPETTVWFASTP